MKKLKIFQITFILILTSSKFFGQDNFNKVAQSGMQFLKVGVGAEMVGRGEAGISNIKGVSAMFWNPAGLAELEGNEFIFSHNAWIADISMNAVGIGMNLYDWGTFGINLVWMDYGELYKTSVASSIEESAQYGYVDEGTFSPSDLAVGLSYSKKVTSQFSFGGQIKYIYENYGSNRTINTTGEIKNTNNTMSAFCFDFGTLYYPGYESLALSMTIQNFSTDLKYQHETFSTPLTFKIGLSMNMLDFFDDKSSNELLFAIDALHPRDYSERLNIGLEYSYLGMFKLRSGYRFNYDEGNFTAGAGIRYSLSNSLGLKMDVSYIIMSSGRFSWPLQLTAGLIMF
ncbi:MAG: PorV/PorQ family protein [Ignavibacteriae bacterium]|nr:PorV/PorQ family protein [Ignavibacteriota bacterium]